MADNPAAGTIPGILVMEKLRSVQNIPKAMRFVTSVGVIRCVSAMGALGTTAFWYLHRWLAREIRPTS